MHRNDYSSVLRDDITLLNQQGPRADRLVWAFNKIDRKESGVVDGVYLDDELGSGKTLIILMFLAKLKEQGKLKDPVVIVVHEYCTSQWFEEIDRFIKPVCFTSIVPRTLPRLIC